ncbi:MAG: hypothetical protein KGS61_03895 [Verrucomicrobia bacterium]|nr:hypothetical protein [Verrucomicrobiota bacterium]
MCAPNLPNNRAPRADTPALRFLFYSHDGQGLGHIRRNLAIAWELTRMSPNASALLATGANPLEWAGRNSRLDVLKLPELRKVANQRYASRRLRLPEEGILALRSSLLKAAVQTYQPHVLLADKHPLGLKGELVEALEALMDLDACAILGLRDILDTPERVAAEWASEGLPARITDYYESVLIYGQHELFNPVATYRFPQSVAGRTSFCGYVVSPNPDPPYGVGADSVGAIRANGHPWVLATAGGGEDGFLMLETFMRACAGAPWHGVVVGGPLMSNPEAQVLRRLAEQTGVQFETRLAELGPVLGSVDAVVCMGGYNTLLEALAGALPVVCVPRAQPRAEQLLRAQVFRKSGLLEFVEPQDLHPSKLRQLIHAGLGRSRRDLLHRIQTVLRFGGARRAATHLLVAAAAVRNRWSAGAPSCRVPAWPALVTGGRGG